MNKWHHEDASVRDEAGRTIARCGNPQLAYEIARDHNIQALRRDVLIRRGKIWTVHTHESIKPERVFFEGTRTQCLKYLKDCGLMRNYRNGVGVRLGRTIWEAR